jgi:hypothetical protein
MIITIKEEGILDYTTAADRHQGSCSLNKLKTGTLSRDSGCQERKNRTCHGRN